MLVSSFAINMLALALPIVILQFYDRIIPEPVQRHVLGSHRRHVRGGLPGPADKNPAINHPGAGRVPVLITKARVSTPWTRLLQADNLAFGSGLQASIDRIHALESIREFCSQSMLLIDSFLS